MTVPEGTQRPEAPEPVPEATPGYRGPYRYARWDGTQRLPDLSADEVLDALSDDLMAEGDLAEALRRLFERGMAGRAASEAMTDSRPA